MPHLDLDTIQRFLRARQSDAERSATLAHLRECRECQAAVREEQRFSHLLSLADDPLEKLDPARTERRAAAELRGPRARRFGLLPAAILSSVIGYAGGRVWPVSNRPPSSVGPPPTATQNDAPASAASAPSSAPPRADLESQFVPLRADFDYYRRNQQFVMDIEFVEAVDALLRRPGALEPE